MKRTSICVGLATFAIAVTGFAAEPAHELPGTVQALDDFPIDLGDLDYCPLPDPNDPGSFDPGAGEPGLGDPGAMFDPRYRWQTDCDNPTAGLTLTVQFNAVPATTSPSAQPCPSLPYAACLLGAGEHAWTTQGWRVLRTFAIRGALP
jgi:hypothetical protein